MNPSHPQRGSRAAALLRAAVLCLLCTWVGQVQAAPPTEVWQAVSDRALDRQRGGFFFGGDLEVSFGISRSVFINGVLITETVLNIARLTDITPEWAVALREVLQSLTLVQNGPGNTFVAGPVSGTSPPGAGAPAASGQTSAATAATTTAISVTGTGAGTVIQNTLNNQQILQQTIINASSNSLGMLRLSTLHSTLSESIRESVGLR